MKKAFLLPILLLLLSVSASAQLRRTTVTSGGTTTLTASSRPQQYFTGTMTQTVDMPDVSTLVLGRQFIIVNNSTGVVTVRSSGGDTIQAMASNTAATYRCNITIGTTAASWTATYFTLSSGGSSGGGGGSGDALTTDSLDQFSSTSSAQLASLITNETGTGSLVFATSPTLVTPNLGTPSALAGTNITGLPLTSGVTGTLPVANGGTGVTSSTGSGSNVLSTSPTLVTPALGTPSSGVATNLTGLPLTSGVTGTLPVANGGTNASSAGITAFNNITGYTASGATGTTSTNLVFSTSPTLVTPALGTPSALVGTNITGTASGLTAGAATTATNLAGGSGGTIPYQSAAGTTAMLANGTAGYVLQSNGTTLAPTWVAASSPLTAYLSSDVVYNNTTTFTNLTGLSVTVVAGGVYRIEATVPVTMTTGGQPKFDWDGGTATATSFVGESRNTANTVAPVISALNTSATGGNLTGTSVVTFNIILRVNTGGTLIPRAAQNSAHASDTTILTGSNLTALRLN